MKKELNVAITAAKEAGLIQLKYFKKNKDFFVRNKNPRDLLTKVDIEAEKKIISLLKKHFPSYSILAEESGSDIKDNTEYMWAVDPLDGTANFFKGHRDFCVLISLSKGDDILLGVTWFPLTEELYIAEKGNGATKNGNKISVSNETDIINMYASTQMSSKLDVRRSNLKLYEEFLFQVRNIHVINSCIARLLTDVAEGIADFYFRIGLNYWDYAAGSLLVQEAGGKATEFTGKPITINSKNALISNGVNHEELLKRMKLE